MNPELRRNLWLELTTHRLVIAPVLLMIVLALVASQAYDPWDRVFGTAIMVFVVALHIWGTRKASEAVTEEVRERTWDWQRLSSLPPWRMTWGKLAGAPAFPWYIAALCAVAMAIAGVRGPVRTAPWVLVGLVSSAIMLHGVGLAVSIQASRKDSRLGGRAGLFLLVPVGLVVGIAFAQNDLTPQVTWHGFTLGFVPFIAASATAFAAWGVLSAYREMQRELKVRALPWAYPAFALFVGAYVAGFDAVQSAGVGTAFVFGTFFASMALTYYGLFADVTTAMGLRRVLLRARRGEWRRAAELLPLWATVLPVAALFAVLSSMQPMPEAMGLEQKRLGLYPVAMFLMALRDAGLLTFFALSPRARRVEGTTLVYILLLSWILPTLFTVMGLEAVSRLLVPFKMGGWQASLVMLVHVAIVWSAALVRGRRLERSLEGARPV